MSVKGFYLGLALGIAFGVVAPKTACEIKTEQHLACTMDELADTKAAGMELGSLIVTTATLGLIYKSPKERFAAFKALKNKELKA